MLRSFTAQLYIVCNTDLIDQSAFQAHVLSGYKLPGGIGDTNVKFRFRNSGRRLAKRRCTVGLYELLPENINVS